MNKQVRYAYSCVWQGWWKLLDKYIPAILEIDPECTFEPKEKFGEMRLQACCTVDGDMKERIWKLERNAEDDSQTVCEFCGEPEKLRTDRSWIKTLCDKCAALDEDGMRAVFLEHRRLLDKLEEA